MRIDVSNVDGVARVEVIDPSDSTVTHGISLQPGEKIILHAMKAHTPSDLEVGSVEAIPEPEAESAEAGETEEPQPGEAAEAGSDAEQEAA